MITLNSSVTDHSEYKQRHVINIEIIFSVLVFQLLNLKGSTENKTNKKRTKYTATLTIKLNR